MLTVWNNPTRDDAGGAPEYTLAPNVTLVLLEDGTARLLNLGGGYFALAAVGAQMLRGALEKGSHATVAQMAHRYGVSPEQVRRDLEALLRELNGQGLLQPGGWRSRDCAPGLASVLIPLLYLIRALPFLRLRAVLTLTLAKLAVACFGMARTIGAVRLSIGRPNDSPIDERTIRAVDQAVRAAAAGHLIQMACKERGLACWALTCWAGVRSALVIGLELFPLSGHCWCEAGPWVLSDYDDNCAMYTPVIRYEAS
jgi:hypothetical protein